MFLIRFEIGEGRPFTISRNYDVGKFISDSALIECVAEMAKSSATGDPRFMADPITPRELNELDIEISVLSPLKRTDDPMSLSLGTDGIYIKKGRSSGCFRLSLSLVVVVVLVVVVAPDDDVTVFKTDSIILS